MLQDHEKSQLFERFLEIERTNVNGQPIGEIVRAVVEESEALMIATDPIAPILRTALVINWRESAMKKRYESFRQRFPNIDSLSSLQTAIDETLPIDFCANYLGIHANPDKPGKNPKYMLLKALTRGFIEYQGIQNIQREIEAIRHWADRVDIDNLKGDPIGNLHGVGPGTVENIRLNLGYSTVKPDRHVIGVAKKVLGIASSPLQYTQLAKFIGINPRRFDSVLFEYGKAAGVSFP